MRKLEILAIVLAAVLATGYSLAPGAEPEPPQQAPTPPSKLPKQKQPAELPAQKGAERFEVPVHGTIQAPPNWMFGLRVDGHDAGRRAGKEFGIDVRPDGGRVLEPPFQNSWTDGYTARYYYLKKGDIVRIFDGVYRMDVNRARRPVFERLGESELPEGIRLHRDTYPIPIGPIGGKSMGDLNSARIVAKQVEAPSKEDGPRIEVTSFHRVYGPRDAEWQDNKKKHLVRFTAKDTPVKEGDVLQLRDKHFRVRQVVPSDPKKQLIGWIEFDQKPVDQPPVGSKNSDAG